MKIILCRQWSCSVASEINYGADCGVFGSANTTSSVIRILPNALTPTISYAFLVIVTSLDGRSDSKTVLVTAASAGTPVPTIATTFTTFNPKSKLVVNGHISSATAVTAEWSVFTPLGVPVPFIAQTHALRQFPATDALSNILFPISLDGDTLFGGRAYVFRLTSYTTSDPGTKSYTEIVLTANSAPTGGYVSSVPLEGDALVTNFLISSPGWTTAVANFPLSFAFSFTLSARSPYLTLAASSLRAFTTSMLPAGLSTEDSMVTLHVEAVDIFSSYGEANTTARVSVITSTNISNILTSQLQSAFSSGNVNLAFQTVNNVSYFFDFKW